MGLVIATVLLATATPASAHEKESEWRRVYVQSALGSLGERGTTDVEVTAKIDHDYHRSEANFCTREPIAGNPLSLICLGDDGFQPNRQMVIQKYDSDDDVWRNCAWTRWTGRLVEDNLKMRVRAEPRCGDGYYRTKTTVYFNRPTNGVRVSVVNGRQVTTWAASDLVATAATIT